MTQTKVDNLEAMFARYNWLEADNEGYFQDYASRATRRWRLSRGGRRSLMVDRSEGSS